MVTRSLIINSGGESSRIIKDFPNLKSKSWLEISDTPILILNITEFIEYVNEIFIIVKNESIKTFFIKN